LLEQFKLTNRICKNATQISGVLSNSINFRNVELKLSIERDRTREYLKSNLI
jgi:hypothetical protein